MSEKQTAIRIEQLPEAVVAHVQVPDLDEKHIAVVRTELGDLVAAEEMLPVILDLSRVKFVPSLTLGVLVHLVKQFRTRRQRLILVNLQPVVRQLFAITQLNKLFEIQEDIPTALRSLSVGG